MKRKIPFILVAVCILNIIFLAYSQVDNRLTAEDILYIKKILSEGKVQPINPARTYENELNFIVAVQKAVGTIIAKGECLPKGSSREPKDVYFAKCGESYDRSRVIEKILRKNDFRTRHIMIYSTEHTMSKIKSLVSPSVLSHSITEVLTMKGWLVIDPDDSMTHGCR